MHSCELLHCVSALTDRRLRDKHFLVYKKQLFWHLVYRELILHNVFLNVYLSIRLKNLSFPDTPYQGALINGFALVANIGITTAWGPVQTITIELYPTVIRYEFSILYKTLQH